MKLIKLLSICMFSFGIIGFSQNKKITKTGTLFFEASVPSFEEVKATNDAVTCILNTKTGEIASLALIKGFHFRIALMEEHFNKFYINSDRYPKATFKGIIEGFNWDIIGKDPKEFKMKGKLELHGKSKKIATSVTLRKIDNDLEILSAFSVNSDDFNIKIPQIVKKKVSKIVTIKTAFLLK